jgi:hypothetical protein
VDDKGTEPADPVRVDLRGALLTVERGDVGAKRERGVCSLGAEPSVIGVPHMSALFAPVHIGVDGLVDHSAWWRADHDRSDEGVELPGGVASGQKTGVHAIVGSETPGVETFTPGPTSLPPMNVGAMLTLIGPTFGGTNVRRGGAAAGVAGAVAVASARAPATGPASASGMRTAVAADNHGIRIRISFDRSRSRGAGGL